MTDNMNEFYKRMNIRNSGKTTIADFIMNESLNNEKTLVLDLGAGSCVIEQMLTEQNFKGSMLAIDKNKTDIQINNDKFEFLVGDLIEEAVIRLLQIISYDTVIIVLSAVLHELNKIQINELITLIRMIGKRSTIYLVIREPLITKNLITQKLKINFLEKIRISFDTKFKEYKKMHRANKWNKKVTFLNYCFLKSYGEQSWKREKYEGRYTFTEKEMLNFVKECGCMYPTIYYEKDEFYKTTLPYDIYDKIYHTSNLIITKGE